MSIPRKRSKLQGDFSVPSFYGNMENVPRGQCKNYCREESGSSIFSSKRRHPLRDQNIGDNSFVSNPRTYLTLPSSKYNKIQEKLGDCHEKQRSSNKDTCSDVSDITLERKSTEVFQHSFRPTPEMYKQQQSNGLTKKESKDKAKPCAAYTSQSTNKDLKIVLKTLKQIFKATPISARDSTELNKLYETVKTVQEEQEHFRDLIKSQQDQINKFHSKYLEAENVIKWQKYEIKQLNHTNTQLENELNTNINELKEKLQEKINEVASLPQAVNAEKTKADKLSKQNRELIARLQEVKHELALTRSKLVETAQKRTSTLNKLKSSEKDLKIFRNQNNILKTEKRTILEELKRQKSLNDSYITKSLKNTSRQKERSESQQRLLQKKILDLELELTRSRNSTSDLIEERDKLIAELQQQLNTLVHNFEVSQKHIRVLKKHINSVSGTAVVPQKA